MTTPADYLAALTRAALFDRSSTAKLEVTGPDAPKFLSNLSTNDLTALPLGDGCETYFLDHRAKTLFQTWAYHVRLADGRPGIWLETVPGHGERLLKHLDRYLISEAVELADVTERFAQFHLAGPMAASGLATAVGSEMPALAEFQHLDRTIGDAPCSIRRRDILGVPGFDIVCTAENAESVRSIPATVGTAETYETLRIEAGTPVYGIDIDENRFVLEIANAPRAICYTKGCYLGQEPIVMSRDRAGHVNRAFLGLKVLTGGPLERGTKLTRDGQEVGTVTSSTESPRLGVTLALGYIKRGHQDAGTLLDAGGVSVEMLGWPPLKNC